MNGEMTLWNCGLLFAALIAILGVAGLVSFPELRDRWLASGLVLQGIVLLFAAGIARFPTSIDLRIGGLTVIFLLVIQSLFAPSDDSVTGPQNQDASQ